MPTDPHDATNEKRPKIRAAGGVRPPQRYQDFIERFPDLSRAWEAINTAGKKARSTPAPSGWSKLGVAMGAMREGAVRSGVRKALAMGIPLEEIEQVVPLAAGTLGMPSAVACWSWILEAAEKASGVGADLRVRPGRDGKEGGHGGPPLRRPRRRMRAGRPRSHGKAGADLRSPAPRNKRRRRPGRRPGW